MALVRHTLRSMRPSMAIGRCLSTTPRRLTGPGNAKEHSTAEGHRKIQQERPLNPHLSGKHSTIGNKMPSAGAHESPPDLLTSVDPNYSNNNSAQSRTSGEMGVGELEGAKFKIEPLRRTGEDINTMRARLLCSRLFQMSILETMLMTVDRSEP
jgi:hypothetical protein